MQRSHFGRQPARILLVDLSSPFDVDTCHNVCEALEHFFSLVCTLGGPCRVPFFGLFALGTYPEALFPLQHVRTNFTRLHNALNELTACEREGVTPKCKLTSCLSQGLQEAGLMFKRQAQSLLQTTGYWSQLEITMLTCQPVHAISKEVEIVTRNLDLDSLKKVQVVCVLNPDHMSIEDNISGSSQNSCSSEQTSKSDMGGLVDYITIEHDGLSLLNFFKGWLQDNDTDKEHLHLIFPGEQGLVLKCDLKERVLNPSDVMHGQQFSLHPDRMGAKPLSVAGGKIGQTVPVHELNVISRIPGDAICESVLFGLPLITQATTCWKMDWDELETNQQTFSGLCHELRKENQVLLTQLKEDVAKPSPGFRYQVPAVKPTGCFLLQPSQSSTLLIKSIATSELMLPCDLALNETPSEECLQHVKDALRQVPHDNFYNPLLVKSGLFQSLFMQLNKNQMNMQRKRKPLSRSQVAGEEVGTSRAAQTSRVTWEDQQGPYPKAQKTSKQMTGKDFYEKPLSPFPTEL